MEHTQWYIAAVLVLIVAAGAWFFLKPAAEIEPYQLALAAGDSVASWDSQGVYSGNAALTAKAETEIARLKKLIGKGEYTDYELYVSIANQYGLLGKGAEEFEYLRKALAVDATGTGLAWHNAGVLLDRVGAYASARNAYEHAAQAQPIPQYLGALLDFLTARYPQDTAAIAELHAALAGFSVETGAQ